MRFAVDTAVDNASAFLVDGQFFTVHLVFAEVLNLNFKVPNRCAVKNAMSMPLISRRFSKFLEKSSRLLARRRHLLRMRRWFGNGRGPLALRRGSCSAAVGFVPIDAPSA